MNSEKPLIIKLEQVLPLIRGEGIDAFLTCPFCHGKVPLNGPGSDQTIMGKFSKWIAWKISSEAQELAMKASRLHDFQGHIGLSDSEENKVAAKQYKENFYKEIELKYKPILKDLQKKKSNLKGGFSNWFLKLGYDRRIARLRRRWKELELIAEAHYGILIEFGEPNMVKVKCWIYKEIYGVTRL